MSVNLNMNLIGLVAKKRSGKDTCADYLCKYHGYTKYAFAGPLKKACAEIFMLSEEQVEGVDKETMDERWGVSARTIFQKVGTEMFRQRLADVMPEMESIKNNFWIYRFQMWYSNFKKTNPNGKVVVSDVRFPNEAEIVRTLGGTVVKVYRDTGMETDEHLSEKNIDLISGDIDIENNADLETYYKNIEKFLGNDIEDKKTSLKNKIRKIVIRTLDYLEMDGTKYCKERACLYYTMNFLDVFGSSVPIYPDTIISINDKVEIINEEEVLMDVLIRLQGFLGMIKKSW